MASRVITVEPHHTVEHVRRIMERNRIHAVPVVGVNKEALGIVTTADLARRVNDRCPVSRIMSENVTVVPAYNDASVAGFVARMFPQIDHSTYVAPICNVWLADGAGVESVRHG
jgi:CBS domain-containing protein